MPSISSANVANAIAKFVASRGLPALRNATFMSQFVTRDYDTDLASGGDTVNIPVPGTMQANDLAEGGTVQTQNPSLGNAQVTLDRHIEATFKVPDIVKLMANPDLLPLYMEPAMIALAEKIDTDILNLYPFFTANPALGTGGAGLASEATIDAAERVLFESKVPAGARKILITSPAAYSDLRQIPRFTEEQTAGDGSPISTGTIGRLKSFEVYRTQLVPKVSTTTYNLAFTPGAITLVSRMAPAPIPGTGAVAEAVSDSGYTMQVVLSYDANSLQQQFTVHVIYGLAVVRNQFGVSVLS